MILHDEEWEAYVLLARAESARQARDRLQYQLWSNCSPETARHLQRQEDQKEACDADDE